MKFIDFFTVLLFATVGVILCEIPLCPTDPTIPTNFMPDHEDCQKYWVCTDGVPFLMQCPANLCFDKDIDDCTYPSDGVCPKDDSTTFFPDPENCSKYWQCANGNKFHMNCPAGLWFNSNKNQCDYISKHPLKEACADSMCPPGSTELYPVDDDPTEYIQCQDGYAHVMSCCVDQYTEPPCYFNNQTKSCITKNNSTLEGIIPGL